MRNIAIALVILFSCTQIAMAGNGSYDYAYSYRLGGETYYCKSNGTCITFEEKVNREWAYQKGLSNALNGTSKGVKYEISFGKYSSSDLAHQDLERLQKLNLHSLKYSTMIKELSDGTYTIIKDCYHDIESTKHDINELAFHGISTKLTQIDGKKETNIAFPKVINKETSIYYLNDSLETVPDKYREYFKTLNTTLNQSYKNTKDITGEVSVLFKFDKKGNLISRNQYDLMREYNKILDVNFDRPLGQDEMLEEIIASIESAFPVTPIDATTNSFIVVKHYTAQKAPFIKPTDKAITKVGKGVLMGVGSIIALPFVILSGN